MTNAKKQPSKIGRKMDGTFSPGSVPNPKGRPQGSKNKATILAQSMFDDQSEELVNKAITLALNGDQAMLRICLERLVPVRRDAPLTIRLPKIEGLPAVSEAMKRIIKAVSDSKLTPEEGNKLTAMLEKYLGVVELATLEKRIKKLEEHL
jgi:hypothetical protein